MKIVGSLNSFLWSWGVSIPILIFGIAATVIFRAPWARMFKQMIRNIFAKNAKDGVSPFKTVCATIGGQVGTGNVVGVATAIGTGGPGALFWMWITAFLGMTTMMVETTLGQLYKRKKEDGTYIGGLAYFVSDGMKLKWLGKIAAFLVAIGTGMVTVMTCVNGIADAVQTVMPEVRPIYVGMILAVCAGFIVFGGFRRLADFASAVVPFMTAAYVILAFIVLVTHLPQIPGILALVVKSALTPQAAFGGAAGYGIKSAFRYGMARGIFSNEAGQGTTCTISAASDARHPVTQALLGSLGVAVDTLLVCTATGIIILLSGADYTQVTGAALSQMAFGVFFGNMAPWIIAVALLFFAFTSIVSSLYNGGVQVQFLTGNTMVLRVYTCLQIAVILAACVFSPTEMFELTDLSAGLMSLVNVIAMVVLFKQVKACIADYEFQLKQGIKEPVFDWDKFRREQGIEDS